MAIAISSPSRVRAHGIRAAGRRCRRAAVSEAVGEGGKISLIWVRNSSGRRKRARAPLVRSARARLALGFNRVSITRCNGRGRKARAAHYLAGRLAGWWRRPQSCARGLMDSAGAPQLSLARSFAPPVRVHFHSAPTTPAPTSDGAEHKSRKFDFAHVQQLARGLPAVRGRRIDSFRLHRHRPGARDPNEGGELSARGSQAELCGLCAASARRRNNEPGALNQMSAVLAADIEEARVLLTTKAHLN